MATGDIVWFNAALKTLGDGAHKLGSDTLKAGIIKGTTPPTAATADPRWGAGGSTNFATDQVSTSTEYSGPVTLGNTSWALSGGLPVLKADDIEVDQDSGGFTDAKYVIIYNDSSAGKEAIAFVDARTTLGGARSLQDGPFKVEWHNDGALRLRQPS